MKTAISLPDSLYRTAEKTARRLGMSRSQLYTEALREFLERRDAKSIVERLNAVYTNEPAKVDPVFEAAQMASLEPESW